MTFTLCIAVDYYRHHWGALATSPSAAPTPWQRSRVAAASRTAMPVSNGSGSDAIAGQMKAIRSGDKDQSPGLADLSDEDIADIAAYLDGA